MRFVLLFIAVAASGCSFKVAKGSYDQGFSSSQAAEGHHRVRYNGKGMEPQWALERLLRKGVAELCGNDSFQLSDVSSGTEDVMHRWEPEYRYVVSTSTISRMLR